MYIGGSDPDQYLQALSGLSVSIGKQLDNKTETEQ